MSGTKPQTKSRAQVSVRRYQLTAASIAVRDNFGRNVHLRFQVTILQDEPPLHVSAGSLPSGQRTPRAALFDTQPFAEVVPVEAIGFSASASNARSACHSSSGIFRVQLLNPEVAYSTVSTLAIFPQNNPIDVETIADAFAFDLDAVIKVDVDEALNHDRQVELHALRQQIPFPTPCTVRTALTDFLELSTVTREFIRIASGFVVTSDERDLLENLSSSDGSSAFRTQIQDHHKGIIDVLAIAPTLQTPLEVFVNITQTIKPRYFTIASSPKVSVRHLDLAVALGNPGDPRGLAATFFHRLLVSESAKPVPLRGFISGSRFQFVDDGVSPMVFITTAVGFTAMRAIIQDRLVKWRGSPEPLQPGSANHILFLGSTNEESIVFRNDLLRWEQELVLKVHFAFSNDRRHPRRYVQDLVARSMDEIVQIMDLTHGSRIFVCGRVAMVRRIREIFEADQVRRHSRWFDSIHASGRYIEEGYENSLESNHHKIPMPCPTRRIHEENPTVTTTQLSEIETLLTTQPRGHPPATSQ